MDDDQKIEESLVRVYEAAPEAIRNFIDEDGVDAFALRMQSRMKLHVDVAQELANRILLTLLGVIEPTNLPAELKTAGVADEQVDEVLKAANEAIFLPLREEMRNAPQAPAQPQVPVQAPSSPQAPLVSVPTPIAMPQAPAPQPVVPTYVPPTPQPPAPVYTPPAQPVAAPEPYIPATPPPAPVARTMAHDVEAMKDGHFVPAWAPPATPAPVQQAAPAAPVFTPMPAPVTAPAPQPKQSAYVPPPINALRAEPVAPKQPASDTLPERKEITDTLKKYGIDPYHEPVD